MAEKKTYYNNNFTDKGDIIRFNNEVRMLGNFKFDRKDPNVLDIIKAHCDEYRNLCMEYEITPTWEGLSLALGKSRHTVTQWRDGTVQWAQEAGVTEYLQGEWAWLNSILVSSMVDGRVDRITGIFYARNNYGYKNEDVEVKRTEVNVNLSMEQLIEGAKNLQIATQDKKVTHPGLLEKSPSRKPKKATAPQLNEELELDFD